jgi:hypothetical protein
MLLQVVQQFSTESQAWLPDDRAWWKIVVRETYKEDRSLTKPDS